MKTFLLWLWCLLPKCWYYTLSNNEGVFTILYIWVGYEYDVFKMNGVVTPQRIRQILKNLKYYVKNV